MILGAYTSSEKAGRLFFKRTAVFFWEDSEWGAGLFARAPKGEPVYFSMICSASSSRRGPDLGAVKSYAQIGLQALAE